MANVPMDRDLRKKVGEILSSYIESGLEQLGDAPDWWELVRAVHRNENRSGASYRNDSGNRTWHVPLSQPRQDALTAQVCQVVAKQEPIMLDVSDDDDVADAKAELNHRIWMRAQFPKRFKNTVHGSTDTDLMFQRVCPLGQGTGKIEISVHQPEDVVVFPALPSGFVDATIVGHRIYKRKRDIQVGREAGLYYSDKYDKDLSDASPLTQEDRGDVYDRSGVTESSSPLPELDNLVELWDVVVWLGLDKLKEGDEKHVGKDERWYRATVCKDDREVLALEPYPYSRPWYFCFRVMGGAEFYPAVSVGRNLLPIQDAYNQLISDFHAGARMAAMPPIFSPAALSMNGEKYTQYEAGDVAVMDAGGGSPWAPSLSPALSPIPVLVEKLEQLADKTARISENTTGGTPAGQTATAASITAAGVATGIEQYIETVTEEMPEMAAFTMEIVANDFEGFARAYNVLPMEMKDAYEGVPGGQMPIFLDPASLTEDTVWEVNGQSPNNSPQMILQTAELLMNWAMDPTTGIQKYDVVKAFKRASVWKNDKDVQISREELARRLAPPVVGPMGPNGAPMVGTEPPAGNGGFPPSPVGPGGA